MIGTMYTVTFLEVHLPACRLHDGAICRVQGCGLSDPVVGVKCGLDRRVNCCQLCQLLGSSSIVAALTPLCFFSCLLPLRTESKSTHTTPRHYTDAHKHRNKHALINQRERNNELNTREESCHSPAEIVVVDVRTGKVQNENTSPVVG